MNEIYMQMWTSLANYDTNRPFHFWLHGLVIRQVQRFRVKSWRRFQFLNASVPSLGKSLIGINNLL